MNSIDKIELHPYAGTHISKAVLEASLLALSINRSVILRFNGVDLVINGHSDLIVVEEEYHRLLTEQ